MSAVLGRLVFEPTGHVGGVYTDDLRDYYAALGATTTVRAGHVEPEGNGWVATLEPWVMPGANTWSRRSPCYPTRGHALEWERVMVNLAIEAGAHP